MAATAGRNVTQVQTPGAQPAAAPQESQPSNPPESGPSAPDAAEPAARELPPDLKAIVAAEVAKALALQKATDAKATAKAGRGGPLPKYADVVAAHNALPDAERAKARPTLTDLGWFVPREYGAHPNAGRL